MHSPNGIPATDVSKVIQKYVDIPGGLLPLLHEIQAGFGFIPKDCVPAIASGMGLSRAEVHGFISFYGISNFLQPGGERGFCDTLPHLR